MQTNTHTHKRSLKRKTAHIGERKFSKNQLLYASEFSAVGGKGIKSMIQSKKLGVFINTSPPTYE